MKLNELYQIQKLYFGHEEVARALGITPASARVAAGRYVKQGLLVRVKRNMYMLRETWKNAGMEEKFQIANMGQVPSYISLMTALDYHGVTTQVQRDFFESIALQRTREIRVNNTTFNYTKISKILYFGFRKEKGFFIAIPEKALLDAFYLMSYGRYSLDLSAIDAYKLDQKQLAALSETFPLRTRNLLRANEYLPAA
jgi:predicted transcriptional regulator of viral defense system